MYSITNIVDGSVTIALISTMFGWLRLCKMNKLEPKKYNDKLSHKSYFHDRAFTLKIDALRIIHGHAVFQFFDGNCLFYAVAMTNNSHPNLAVITLRNNIDSDCLEIRKSEITKSIILVQSTVPAPVSYGLVHKSLQSNLKCLRRQTAVKNHW